MMSTGRPEIRVERSNVDRALEISALVLLLAAIAWPLVVLPSLPAQIPIHFTLSGQPNHWGPKAFILILPGVAVFLWLLLTGVGFIPAHYYNFPIAITPENAARQYRLARRLLVILKVEIVATFLLLEWTVIHSARGNPPPGVWVVVVILAVIFGTIALFVAQSLKHR